MGKQQNRIQDRFGLLQVCSVNAAMASITKTLTAFSKERQVIQRERASSAYPVVSYFVSKLAAETPVSAAFPLVFSACVYPMCGLNNKLARFATFAAVTTLESFTSSALGLAVGALTPSPEAANALGPAIMVIFIVFGGLYVQPANVPAPLRWIPNTSLIRHCFDALSCNEMRGLEFETERPTDLPTGDAALERFHGEDFYASPNTTKFWVPVFWLLLFTFFWTISNDRTFLTLLFISHINPPLSE